MSENINMHGLSILEELDVKFGPSKSKQQIVQSLENSNMLLHCIPLPNPNVTSEQTQKDFRRERVLLNDVPFIPDNIDQDRCHAFSFTLKILLDRIVHNRCLIYNIDLYPSASKITDIIMQRACRTSAGADSFFTIQKLLCVEETFVIQRAFLNDPPIRIDVFITNTDVPIETSTTTTDSLEQSAKILPSISTPIVGTNSICVNDSTKISPSEQHYDNVNLGNDKNEIIGNEMSSSARAELLVEGFQIGALCSRTQVMNCFAIYDLSVIDQLTGVVADDPDPWLEVEAVVVDESNFKTGRHWRRLQLVITCPATGKVYTSVAANMDFMKRYLGGLINRAVFLNELSSWFSNISPLHSNNKNKSNKSITTTYNNNLNERKSVINLNTSFDNSAVLSKVDNTSSSSSQSSPIPIVPLLPDSPDERYLSINCNNSNKHIINEAIINNNTNNKDIINNTNSNSTTKTTTNNNDIQSIKVIVKEGVARNNLHDLNELLSELNQTNISPISNNIINNDDNINSTNNSCLVNTSFSSPIITTTDTATNNNTTQGVTDTNTSSSTSPLIIDNNSFRSRRLTKDLQELLYS